MNKTKIILCGAQGRMGQAIIDVAANDNQFEIAAQVIKKKPFDAENNIFCDLHSALKKFGEGSVIVDFSHFSCLNDHLNAAKEYSCPIVIGTTGHDQKNISSMKNACEKMALLYAPNTSLGANLLMALSAIAAKALPDSEIEINDIHHRHKKDAPSGTALRVAQSINRALSIEGEENIFLGSRQNHERKPHEIGINCVRAGNVAGEHTTFFFNENERLEITHKVSDRRVFAQGALIAAKFLQAKKAGLYTMKHVLNLELNIDNGFI